MSNKFLENTIAANSKILIIGSSKSGKSVLAKHIAENIMATNVAYYRRSYVCYRLTESNMFGFEDEQFIYRHKDVLQSVSDSLECDGCVVLDDILSDRIPRELNVVNNESTNEPTNSYEWQMSSNFNSVMTTKNNSLIVTVSKASDIMSKYLPYFDYLFLAGLEDNTYTNSVHVAISYRCPSTVDTVNKLKDVCSSLEKYEFLVVSKDLLDCYTYKSDLSYINICNQIDDATVLKELLSGRYKLEVEI